MAKGLTDLISKAISDSDFRKQLLEHPDEAAQGYDLNESETKMLRNLKADAFDELDMDVEQRQSKSGLGMGMGSLIGGRDASTGDISTLINVLMNKYG